MSRAFADMKPRRLTIRRWILLGVLGLIAAGVVAPYLSADRFGDRIRLALERSLRRKVEMRAARFNLFRGPGFALLGVVIHDDPATGAEPFAYVGSIEARVNLIGLLGGRLEFSSLRLEEPSVNLVKTAAGPWNFQPLLNLPPAAQFPSVSVRGGRLNFKAGGVKSVFYFSNTDLDLSPPGQTGGAFSLEFSGEPTRSDRTARGFGTLRGRGRWRPTPGADGTLEFDLNLEQSALGELATLVYGYDIGVHGQVGGRARFRGAFSALEITGTLELDDIHRWDLLPPYAKGGPLNFRGTLDLLSQNLDLETVPSGQSALAVRFRVFDYLVHPRWVASLDLNGLSVPPLLDVARHMGAGISRDVEMDGSVSGAITYSPESGIRGGVLLSGASISAPDSPPVRLEEAQLLLEGDHVKMLPAAVAAGEREQATLQFDYFFQKQQLDLKLATSGMSIAALQSAGGPLPGMPKPGFVAGLRGGEWEGRLAYHQEGQSPGIWSGAVALRGTRFEVQGLSDPLDIRSAGLTLQGDRVEARAIEAAAAGVEIRGQYDYRPGVRRPNRVALRLASLRGSDIEKLLAPTLRLRRGFLSRTLRLPGAGVPEWLRGRHVQGALEIGSLEIAGEHFESVRVDFFWDGAELDAPRFTARAAGGIAEGNLAVDLRGSEPSYRVAGKLESSAWRGGRLEGDALITTSGAGEALRRNLRAEGSFRAQSVRMGAETAALSLAGAWSLVWERKGPRLQLTGLRFTDGDEVLTGQGTTTDDERLRIDLAGGDRRIRLAGSLRPLLVSESEARPSP